MAFQAGSRGGFGGVDVTALMTQLPHMRNQHHVTDRAQDQEEHAMEALGMAIMQLLSRMLRDKKIAMQSLTFEQIPTCDYAKLTVTGLAIDALHLWANTKRQDEETSCFMKGVVFVAVEIGSILNTVLAVAETLIRGIIALIAYPFAKFNLLDENIALCEGWKFSLQAIKASAMTIFQNCTSREQLGPESGSVLFQTFIGMF